MSKNVSSSSSSGGIGFLGLLTILFIALKLTNHIDWSWWLVLAPLWAPFALIVLGGVVYVGWYVFENVVLLPRRRRNPISRSFEALDNFERRHGRK